MKLQHYDLENPIDFGVGSVWTLVCESPRLFSKLTRDFCNPVKEDGWSLYDGNLLDLSKYAISLIDFHNVSLNDKRAASLLQDCLKKTAFDERHTVATHGAISFLNKYLYDLAVDVDFPTVIKDVDFSVILKCVGISFLEEAENLCEKLTDYVTLISRLTIVKVLICVNLRCYLEVEELIHFFRHCEQSGINLLCMESSFNQAVEGESVLYCDKDMCEYFTK